MSEPLEQAAAQPRKHGLREAIRRVRLVNTEQADGLADLRDAERARLELLADSLSDLFAEVPDELDFFTFALSNGEALRLWIDMTCHVAMGRDRRTYRLLKDTRLGRTVLYETADREEMAVRITDYVAERVLGRQRAIEGDWIEQRARLDGKASIGEAASLEPGDVKVATPMQMKQPEPQEAANEDVPGGKPRKLMRRREADLSKPQRQSRGSGWLPFFVGLLVGAAGLAVWIVTVGKL